MQQTFTRTFTPSTANNLLTYTFTLPVLHGLASATFGNADIQINAPVLSAQGC